MWVGRLERRMLAVGLAALPPFPFPILYLSFHYIDPPQSNKNTKRARSRPRRCPLGMFIVGSGGGAPPDIVNEMAI